MRTLLTSFLIICMGLVKAQIGTCDQVQASFVPFVSNNTVQFSNGSMGTGAGTLFFWTFGDGTTSQDAQPEHIYPGPGVYEVCLTVVTILTGNNGQPLTCEDVHCAAVTIAGQEPCSPNFLVAMDWVPQGNNSMTFVATSTFPNTSFIWYFGDGTEAYGSTAVHTFSQAGTYAVCVTGWYYNESAQDTCWTEDCEILLVEGSSPCDGVSSCFVTNDLGDGVFFFDNCSTGPNGSQYLWTFGDGTNSTIANVEHTFPGPGEFDVCLLVLWEDCIDSTCTTITVANSNPCDLLDAEFDPFVGGLGVNIQNAVINSEWTYSWTFGDGTTGYGPNTGHQYSAPGVYNICLTVYTWDPFTEDTCYVDHCEVITVSGGPCSPNFLVEMDAQSQGNGLVSFVAASTFPNTNFIWYFGDDSQAFGPVANHTYTQDGTYAVCVTGWYFNEASQDTCWIEDCEQVVVSGTPCNGLNACFVTNDLGNGAYFYDNCSTQNGSAEYFWDLGDGASSNVVNAEHLYEMPGVYTVCLTVFEGNCSDSTCTTVSVAGPCNSLLANFGWSLAGGQAEFDNATLPVGLSTTWSWNFGDGSTSNEENPSHLYTAPGTYQACLTAISILEGGYTCTDTYCVTVVVQGDEPCDPSFAVELAWNAGPNNTVFLTGTSNLPDTYFIWYLGDGSEAYGPSATHTYAQPGTYNICLTGYTIDPFTSDTCWTEDCALITVGGGDPCETLQACFVTNDLGAGGFFFDNCTGGPLGTQYFWSFGDGNTSGGTNVDHQFSSPGTYEVCLTAFWQQCSDSICAAVTVPDEELCDLLVACFEPLPFENGAYLFENCSEVLPIDIPAYAFWDFGDGMTSTEWTPAHAFSPGIYTVCLVMTHGDCVDSTCTTITVNSGGDCDPNYNASFTYDVQNNAVIFIANFDTPTMGVIWTFPDGAQAYEPIHTHLFEPPGPFEVCLSSWYWNEQTQDTCWAYTCQVVDPFNTPTGLDEHTVNGLLVFPVPANDQISISGLDAGAILHLVSADGRLVIRDQASSDTHRMNVQDLAPGTYLLTVEQGGERSYRRVVVE